MVVNQSISSSSSLESLKDLISNSLLTTTQTCLATVQDFVRELQSTEYNQNAAYKDLQQLSTLFSLQLQLIDHLKPIIQSGHQFVDHLMNRLSEKRDGEFNQCDGIDISDLSKYQSDLSNISDGLPISTSKKSKMNDEEQTSAPTQSRNVQPFTLPGYRLPQLSTTTAISFFEKHVIPAMNNITEELSSGMTLNTLVEIMIKLNTYSNLSLNLTNGEVDFQNGITQIDNYTIQTSTKPSNRNNNDKLIDHEVIIVDVDKKEMTVLMSPNKSSLFIEMDSSGMKENEIIDLNREGRRWEGGELNGKPFGFGCEYSEEGNLIYEGFVFEGKKVCFGKEWNDDGNNNCLMYEGGYCNDERWACANISNSLFFMGKYSTHACAFQAVRYFPFSNGPFALYTRAVS